MAYVETLAGRHEAQEIVVHIEVAFWTDESWSEPGYHLQTVDKNFRLLAEKLGYRVERIESDEATA